MNRARRPIHELKHAVLMEGYFDAITAWQANVTNVVTTSGTALGEHQVRLLKRETQELLLAFDRDDAGMNATQRAIELASKSGMYIKVVRVPQGKDPDDFLRAHPDGWANLREHALLEWEYLLRQALANLDLTDARERRRGAELVIPVLAKIPEASVLEIYAQQAAGWLRIEPAALLRDVQPLKSGKGPHPEPERLKRSPGTKAPLAWADGPAPQAGGRFNRRRHRRSGGWARRFGTPPRRCRSGPRTRPGSFSPSYWIDSSGPPSLRIPTPQTA